MDLKLRRRIGLDVVVIAVVLVLAVLGLIKPADDALRNMRFEQGSRPVTRDIVFLAIDPVSLQRVGVWPWPREVHAQVIDRLTEFNAADIFFDVDFSSVSTPDSDIALAAALERAGGFVALAAFVQAASVSGQELMANLPIAPLAEQSEIALVNVRADRAGVVRTYPFGGYLEGELYPSVASYFSNAAVSAREFNVDFGIDVRGVDVISVADLLEGTIDPDRILDKQVVIGASALELRDTLTVPRFGTIPGPLLQVLAAETLKQGRALMATGWVVTALLVLGLFLLVSIAHIGLGFKRALIVGLTAGILAEVGAYFMQVQLGILVDTAACHITLVGLALVGFMSELDFSQVLLRHTVRDRDATQSILNQVISDNFDGVVVISQHGELLAVSKLAETFFGRSHAQAGQTLAVDFLPEVLVSSIEQALAHETDFEGPSGVVEATVENAAGQKREIEYVITVSLSEAEGPDLPAQSVACLTFRDVSARKAHERHLEYIAKHDPLTGTSSRAHLMEVIDATDAAQAEIHVFIVDLTRFQAVNDMFGHDHGDSLLVQAATRLSEMDVACVARIGGDSFALVHLGGMGAKERRAFCDRLVEKLSVVYLLGEHRAIVGARVGVASSQTSGGDAKTLIAHADTALSSAKEGRMARAVLYSPQMAVKMNETKTMEIALNNALLRGEFSLEYQPQVRLSDNRFLGAEALVRWDSATLGRVRPDLFIELAEETGLIVDIGKWVIEEACRQALTWPKNTHMSVNISPMQFELADVLEHIRAALDETGLDAHRLEVEVTEGVLISNTDLVIDALSQLQKMGIAIALDDFGTGFSSLAYLGKLPLNKIKIDQAFVRGLPSSAHGEAVVRSITTLSQSLDKLVVAEGIETQEQARFLNGLGCQIGQGYYFGKPMKGADIRDQFFPLTGKTVAQLAS